MCLGHLIVLIIVILLKIHDDFGKIFDNKLLLIRYLKCYLINNIYDRNDSYFIGVFQQSTHIKNHHFIIQLEFQFSTFHDKKIPFDS